MGVNMSIFYQKHVEDFHMFIDNNLNFSIHLHKHIELVYVLEGTIDLITKDQTYTIEAGNLGLIFPNILHAYHTSETSKVILAIYDLSLTGDYHSVFKKYIPKDPIIEHLKIHKSVLHCLFTLLDDDLGAEPRLFKAYFTMLSGHLLHNTLLEKRGQEENDTLTHQVLSYVTENYVESISIESVAKELGTNTYKISRIFSNSIGYSFKDYINSLRIENAQHLLGTTDLTITAIAYQSGFDSLRTFNRVFKEKNRISPKEYRMGLLIKKK